MNEYQRKQRELADQFGRELAGIAHYMGAGWQVEPITGDTEWAPVWRTLQLNGGSRKIWAQKTHNSRYEFKASKWPSYTDTDGSEKQKFPSDTYNPRETTPTTTAAIGREPAAIARQIVTKILPEYERIYARLEEAAAETQKYHDKTADALKRLAEATGDTRTSLGTHRTGFYLQDLPGDTLCVTFNSVGDVRFGLDTDEAIEVIGLIRELRRKAQ